MPSEHQSHHSGNHKRNRHTNRYDSSAKPSSRGQWPRSPIRSCVFQLVIPRRQAVTHAFRETRHHEASRRRRTQPSPQKKSNGAVASLRAQRADPIRKIRRPPRAPARRPGSVSTGRAQLLVSPPSRTAWPQGITPQDRGELAHERTPTHRLCPRRVRSVKCLYLLQAVWIPVC